MVLIPFLCFEIGIGGNYDSFITLLFFWMCLTVLGNDVKNENYYEDFLVFLSSLSYTHDKRVQSVEYIVLGLLL